MQFDLKIFLLCINHFSVQLAIFILVDRIIIIIFLLLLPSEILRALQLKSQVNIWRFVYQNICERDEIMIPY